MTKRKNYSDSEKRVLYSEVEGRCPICYKQLSYQKNSRIMFEFEIAHIYPLNPSKKEEELLNGQEMLSSDINALENVMAVCRPCHKRFDHPRTLAEYIDWISIKKRLLRKNRIKSKFSEFGIEEEISKVVIALTNNPQVIPSSLSYAAMTLDEKSNSSLTPILKRGIERDIADYFEFVRLQFQIIESESPNSFNIIASQIKTFYLKCFQETKNQTEIFLFLVEWLVEKNQYLSSRACEVVVAFFIQDCEVFS